MRRLLFRRSVMMDHRLGKDELRKRFIYHEATSGDVRRGHERVQEITLLAARELDELLPTGRAKSLAITKLEEVRMWANAAIAHEQKAYPTLISPENLLEHQDRMEALDGTRALPKV